MATQPRMTRDEFLRMYALGPNGTFLANDKGGNSASEVAGQSVADYYDRYLSESAPKTVDTYSWEGDLTGQAPNLPPGMTPYLYSNTNPTFDAWDNVNPHPESNRGNGLEEAWKQVGRPAAAMAALAYGGNMIGNALGSGSGAFSVAPQSGFSFGVPGQVSAGIDVASVPTVSGASGLGATGAAIGAPSLGGSATKAALYGVEGHGPAATAAEMAGKGGSMFEGIGSFLKDNPILTQLGGAALGALSAKDQTATTSRDPWAPAQPYLMENLKRNAAMQDYYAKNPFSAQQQQAYQGLLNVLANNQLAGNGLLANASNFGKSSGGKMPSMQALPTGTTAPVIDWTKYQNIGLL